VVGDCELAEARRAHWSARQEDAFLEPDRTWARGGWGDELRCYPRPFTGRTVVTPRQGIPYTICMVLLPGMFKKYIYSA